jgi:hypothetical protein
VTIGPEDLDGGRRIELTPASAIPSECVRWLWRDRFPLRSLCVVAGEKGLGKSILTNARIPAEASRGLLPGELEGHSIDSLIASAEDDWRSVVKPRLVAHDADLDRVHRVRVKDDDGESLLTLPDDIAGLEKRIVSLRGQGRAVGMLVIDPISAFLSAGTDTHRDASVRRALAPLAALADRLDLVVVVVAHLTKGESTKLLNRVSGSGAFVNAARSLLALAPSPDDPDGESGNERVLVHVRGNWGKLAPTLAARVEERWVDLDDGTRKDVGYLEITGESHIGVDDLQRGADDENTAGDVEEAITAALADGPRPSREVKAQVASDLQCSRKTVERGGVRMSKRQPPELIISPKSGFQPTNTWSLPNGDTLSPHWGQESDSIGDKYEQDMSPQCENGVPKGDSAPLGTLGTASNATVPKQHPIEIVLLVCSRLDALSNLASTKGAAGDRFAQFVIMYGGRRRDLEAISVGDLYAYLALEYSRLPGTLETPGRLELFTSVSLPFLRFLAESGLPLTEGAVDAFIRGSVDDRR